MADTMPQDSLSDRLLLFLHIPKTGGKTLETVIRHQVCAQRFSNDPEKWIFDGLYLYPGPHKFYGFFKEPDHQIPQVALDVLTGADLAAVVGHLSFGIHRSIQRPSTYITLLRQPVERVVSLYHHLSPSCSIEQFVANYEVDQIGRDQTRLITDNDQTRRISGLEPAFGDCTAETLERAKDNLQRHFSVVGVTERFDETLLLIKKRFGWKGNTVYLPRNVNASRPRTSELSQDARDVIHEFNRFDLDLYRFACSLLDELRSQQDQEFEAELADAISTQQQHLQRAEANHSDELPRVQ